MNYMTMEQRSSLRVEGRALDVGGRDGRYTGLIRSFGADQVVVIDPAAAEIQMGIDVGAIEPDCAYIGTIEQWAEENPQPAQSAFVLNMQPRLAGNENFWRALVASLAPGGLLVASCCEGPTGLTAYTTATKVRCLRPINFALQSIPRPPLVAFHSVYFWQKVAGQRL